MFPHIDISKYRDVDVVTVQDPFLRGLFGWYVAKKCKARFNVQVHTDLAAQPFYKRMIAQIVLRHADTIRVVSHKVEAQVKHLGARGRTTVLPVFTDLARFRAVVRHPDQCTILWVGRFEVEKDPFFALEVLRVARKHTDARLIMLGAGSLEVPLKRAAAGLPVEFPGWQDPLPYLATAALVLSTSLEESWGASIVEALAAGVPVVAPDVGVAKEAGATVVSREHIPGLVTEMLGENTPGALLLQLPTQEEWVRQWIDSL